MEKKMSLLDRTLVFFAIITLMWMTISWTVPARWFYEIKEFRVEDTTAGSMARVWYRSEVKSRIFVRPRINWERVTPDGDLEVESSCGFGREVEPKNAAPYPTTTRWLTQSQCQFAPTTPGKYIIDITVEFETWAGEKIVLARSNVFEVNPVAEAE